MDQFRLTIIKSGRAVIAALAFPCSILCALYFAVILEPVPLKVLAALSSFSAINALAIYFAASVLTVTSNGEILSFKWSRKFIFSFKPIEDVSLKEIQTLVINIEPAEQKEMLLSVRTNNRKIKLGSPKYWRKDADAFVQYLKQNTHAETKDSWDILKEQGGLRPFYYLILTVLIVGVLLITYIVFEKGISNAKPQHLFMFIGSYLILIPYWLMMKSKLKKGDNNR